MPEHRFEEPLRALAAEAGRAGTLVPAAELRRRGEARRRRRRITRTAVGAALAGLLTAGVLAGWPQSRSRPEPPATPGPPPLSGTRAVHVVPVQTPETVLFLGDRLMTTTGAGGRQRFVPVPLADGTYQIKGYRADSPDPQCWQLVRQEPGQPSTVWAGTCAADEPDQRFTISPDGSGAYEISSLRYEPSTGDLTVASSGASGSKFLLVDDGPAPS